MTSSDSGHLQLHRVSKVFGPAHQPIRAVDDVCLDVAPGELVTLLGPSGCGKTTTLRIVAGFESATSGEVRLDGTPLRNVAPQQRPMAMVFQSFALFPHLTVRDNIAYGLRLKRLTRSEINEAVQLALTSMNLVGLGDRSPHELSGGQQQRVALARALVVAPTVLLFDEPLSNLDAKLRGAMRAEIRRIQRRLGITSLFVTHDQDEAMSLADRVVVMNKGRIEQVGTPGEIYLRPTSVFVADFIGRANFLEVSPSWIADGTAHVHALGRDLTIPCHDEVRPREAAHLLVRPESITLTPASEQAGGVVLSAAFHGTTAEYEVETMTGTLAVSVHRPDPAGMLGEGARVMVGFDEQRSYILRKS